MPQSIDTAAVWNGEELLARPDWLWTLSHSEIEELILAADAEPDEVTPESFVLPKVSRRLSDTQDSLETGSGATIIRGFPAESVSEAQSTRVFWGTVQQIGTPVSQSAAGAPAT